METGQIRFCTCGMGVKCPAYNCTLALCLKVADLCLLALGLGFNLGVSHFGVSESAQKYMLEDCGYNYDSSTGYYLLNAKGKAIMKGSKFVNPVLPACIFDCVQMKD